MTERLPYEEQLSQQWNNLPLPDENMAWADMKRRLDEDDDKPLLPFWLRGCAGWGLLAMLLLGLGWWFIRPDKWFNKKQEQVTEVTKNDNEKKGDITGKLDDSTGVLTNPPLTIHKDSPALVINKNSTDTLQINEETGESVIILKKKAVVESENSRIKTGTTPRVKKQERANTKTSNKKIKKTDEPVKTTVDSTITVKKTKPATIDSAAVIKVKKIETGNDSVKLAKKEKPEQVLQPVTRKDSSKKKSFTFSSGIALQQQLPVAGQSLVPYNALGRKGSLKDYIPSVYIRLNREEKWFLQSGFRYGAPQLVKEFLYRSKADTISIQKFNITSTYLKKIFYHQLPLTFNYFLLPNFSLGGGIVWNRFSSAVSTRDIIQKDRFTGIDSVLSAGVIVNSSKADSNFIKSYFQATIETQYKWKRFSLGANYSFGLQPHIRFVIPGGQTEEQKNKSLQLFIRYELWKSKGK